MILYAAYEGCQLGWEGDGWVGYMVQTRQLTSCLHLADLVIHCILKVKRQQLKTQTFIKLLYAYERHEAAKECQTAIHL